MQDLHADILVTGGTGFLGSYLLRQLLASGYSRITALRRSSSSMKYVADIQDRIQWRDGDLTDIPSLEEAIRGKDLVYHVAALVSMNPREEFRMKKVNAEGTANLANLSLTHGVDKFLHVSSVAVLGPPGEDGWVSEGHPWDEFLPVTAYGRTKYRGELEVWRAMAEGLNAVIVNPSTVLGSGDWDDPSLTFFRLGHQGTLFYPSGTGGFVDVRDASRFMVELMESDVSGDRMIINGENLPYRDLMTQIANAFGKRPPSMQIGKSVQRLYSWWDALQARLTGQPHIVTSDTVRLAGSHTYYDNSKGVEALSFRYRPISQTVRESCALFQKYRNLDSEVPILPLGS